LLLEDLKEILQTNPAILNDDTQPLENGGGGIYTRLLTEYIQ